MPKDAPKRKTGRLRLTFRYCRITVLTLVLILISIVTYLNQVGIPGFVKNSVLRQLENRGLKARFSRLSWRWHEGVVAENLFVETAGTNNSGPRFSADRAALRFDMNAMGRLQWRFDSVALINGDLVWQLSDTNLSDQLRLTGIDSVLRFYRDDSLELIRFKTTYKGLTLNVTGSLANQGELNRAAGNTNQAPPNLQALNQTMNRVANYLTNFEFAATPELNLRFDADAANWQNLSADLRVRLPELTTSWGNVDQMNLLARVRPGESTNSDTAIELILSGDQASTPWGKLSDWQVHTKTVPVLQLPQNSSNQVSATFSRLETDFGAVENGALDVFLEALTEDQSDEMNLRMHLGGRRLVSKWGGTDELKLDYQGTISRTNGRPIKGTNILSLANVQSTYGRAKLLELSVAQQPQPAGWKSQADDSWGLWRYLEPYILGFSIHGTDVDAQQVQVESAAITGSWAAPRFEVQELKGTLYGGDFVLSGNIDVATGGIGFKAVTDWDYHALDHMFSERFHHWFEPYQWGSAPHVEVSGVLAWPDWNVYHPNWRDEVGPTLGLSGWFTAKNPSYDGIQGLEASSHFHFTNSIWNLPDLTIVRPEGTTVAVLDSNDLTKDFAWNIVADINPYALEPLFKGSQQNIFKHFTNHATPHIEGVLNGRWRENDLLGFEATVSAPKINIRGEEIDQLDAHVSFTNLFLTITEGVIWQSNRVGRAEGLAIDFPDQKMFFTNVTADLPPMSVARAIGPVTAAAVEPYIFEDPPIISVSGSLGFETHDKTDLKFDIDGSRFSWWAFNLDDINGNLHWERDRLSMTNIVTTFYGGSATGGGQFTFYTNRPTGLTFTAVLEDAQLKPLVRDVFGSTNNLDGQLSGELVITKGRSDSRDTWNGYGHMEVRDGMFWDIPIFAIFTPVLNSVSPGLGSSRADKATANFVMINGAIISTDLEVKSTELSMLYKGSVDHLGNVDALTEARILKEAGPFGPLISTALRPLTKLFEYKVTGTLREPEAEPIFIPKFLLLPLEPFKALGDLLKKKPAEPVE